MLENVAGPPFLSVSPELLRAQAEFLLLGGFCLIPIILLIISILIAIWVYKDAESRGMSGVLWLIVVLLAGIIGLIIYLVVRKPKVAPIPAYGAHPPVYAPPPSYGGPPPMGTNCRYCGAPLAAGSPVCPNCGGRF
ncbi:MAG: zinc ribbon domain-containing protein [Thermoplasmata archaeon]